MAVVLRPMLVSDAQVFASWSADPTFCAQAGWTTRSDVEERITWWRTLIANPDPKLVRMTAVCDGDVVGYADLHGDSERARELGFVIGGPERWGEGLGLATAAAGLTYGFDELGLSCIWSEALEANVASVRILQRLGMTYTGRGAEQPFVGVPSVYLQHRMRRRDWERMRLRPTWSGELGTRANAAESRDDA